jgi:hypothetical protein
MNTKCEFKETIYVADEYLAYSIEDKYVKTSNKETGNVKKLTIDDKVIFEYEIERANVDTRKDWAKTIGKIETLIANRSCGLIQEDDYKIERAKLDKELSNYLDKVMYNVDWKLKK